MQFFKSLLVLATASSAAAFSPAIPGLSSIHTRTSTTQIRMSASAETQAKGKVNYKIELDSEKVATMVSSDELSLEDIIICTCINAQKETIISL
jgi:hypothetical protein